MTEEIQIGPGPGCTWCGGEYGEHKKDCPRRRAAVPEPRDQIAWRVGQQIPINVYEGDRPVCQCHTVKDAQRIVRAVNEAIAREVL